MAGRGKKVNQVKNERAHADWMAGKTLGETQARVCRRTEHVRRAWGFRRCGHWEKV